MMKPTRLLPLLALVAIVVTACADTAASPPPPTPIGGTVDTPEDAIAAVIANEPRLTGITPYSTDIIGQSSWYKVERASGVGAFLVQVRVGWGDCPAGCIDEHTWLVAVQPDGAVVLQSESGGPVPPDAWPQPAGAGETETGIVGVAVAGPVCPVETVPPDPACAPRPVAGATIVASDAAGAEIARTTTGIDGAFALALPAGDYVITGLPVEGLMGVPDPTSITVVDGTSTQVQLAYDTGIR